MPPWMATRYRFLRLQCAYGEDGTWGSAAVIFGGERGTRTLDLGIMSAPVE